MNQSRVLKALSFCAFVAAGYIATTGGQALASGDLKSANMLKLLGIGSAPRELLQKPQFSRDGVVVVSSPTQLPLIQPGNLVYQGSFRLPLGNTDLTTFGYGGTSFAFNPVNGTLLGVGHAWHQRVAEFTIPQIRTSSTLSGFDRATLVQPFTDVLAGKLNLIGPSTVMVGGLLPVGPDLIASGYVYYDGNGTQSQSHFKTTMNFSQVGSVLGPIQVGSTLAGWVSGHMAPIPAEWQSLLGGDSLTGQCCIPIISRTSYGPSVSVFTASNVGKVAPVPATRLLGYPQSNPTIGNWASSGTLFNGTTAIGGFILPNGTRTVLFFGRRGLGTFCYGEGTSNLPVGVDPYGNPRCYDPANSSKGNHAYPYESFVWAYDVNDLLAVKQGQKQIWQVQPYATWPMSLPFMSNTGEHLITAAAYDPATQRIFLAGGYSDGTQPLVHVYTLTNGATGLCR
jgi:hypothetical protein